MQTTTRLLIAALLAMLTAACGPQFETNYELSQPTSAQGQACAAQCNVVQQQCFDACHAGERSCEQRARMDDYMDGWMYGGRYGGMMNGAGIGMGVGVPMSRNTQDCFDNACRSHCMKNYHTCYQQCGGRVKTVTKCIDNCPTAPQQLAPKPLAPAAAQTR